MLFKRLNDAERLSQVYILRTIRSAVCYVDGMERLTRSFDMLCDIYRLAQASAIKVCSTALELLSVVISLGENNSFLVYDAVLVVSQDETQKPFQRLLQLFKTTADVDFRLSALTFINSILSNVISDEVWCDIVDGLEELGLGRFLSSLLADEYPSLRTQIAGYLDAIANYLPNRALRRASSMTSRRSSALKSATAVDVQVSLSSKSVRQAQTDETESVKRNSQAADLRGPPPLDPAPPATSLPKAPPPRILGDSRSATTESDSRFKAKLKDLFRAKARALSEAASPVLTTSNDRSDALFTKSSFTAIYGLLVARV